MSLFHNDMTSSIYQECCTLRRQLALAQLERDAAKQSAELLAKELELLNDGASVQDWLRAKAVLRKYRGHPV